MHESVRKELAEERSCNRRLVVEIERIKERGFIRDERLSRVEDEADDLDERVKVLITELDDSKRDCAHWRGVAEESDHESSDIRTHKRARTTYNGRPHIPRDTSLTIPSTSTTGWNILIIIHIATAMRKC